MDSFDNSQTVAWFCYVLKLTICFVVYAKLYVFFLGSGYSIQVHLWTFIFETLFACVLNPTPKP